MHTPCIEHMLALKHILWYFQSTLQYGLNIYPTSIEKFIFYIDVAWGGCLDTKRSTSSYYVFLGDNLIFWSIKRQHIVSHSSVEAE